MRKDIYTSATITTSEQVADIMHIQGIDPFGNSALIVLTQQEFLGKLKSWLRTLPMEQRQLIIDELVACTLRTLE